ncbi:hypothetical protein BWZ27_09485 [Neisseria meningitidis]|nr:hypothetical protein BWZ27_09485 [Neisseria meningitidis]OMH48102.1 hypothetical protein BWZ31_09895 [Neisseria meningitidis]
MNKNQDKATKPQTVQIIRQGEATPYWFLLIHYTYRLNTRYKNQKRTNKSPIPPVPTGDRP